ncbi:hypothetical protein V6N13_034163 [Hibiscus sabdariffa]
MAALGCRNEARRPLISTGHLLPLPLLGHTRIGHVIASGLLLGARLLGLELLIVATVMVAWLKLGLKLMVVAYGGDVVALGDASCTDGQGGWWLFGLVYG